MMRTQLQEAIAGNITEAMRIVARAEGKIPEEIAQGIACGQVVIPANVNHHNLIPAGVGQGLRVKVNANIGTSPAYPDWRLELDKLQVARESGADAVMDLSTGGDLTECRRHILKQADIMVGTVPIYEAAVRTREQNRLVVDMKTDDLFVTIEDHAREGVDFVTVHCGVTLNIVERLLTNPRLLGINSRGGSMLAGWMLHQDKENPLYADFDRLLDICLKYDVTLSLGDGLRPGCLADATDHAQIEELMVLGDLVKRAQAAGVQVMVEGPGHVPFDQIAANMQLQKRLCAGAPFYVLGPLVTDIGAGYDHISAAIGGTMAAVSGADFLCYVTPAEHLGLPNLDDVRDGVIAARIAAHAADLVNKAPGAWERDKQMAWARKNLDWETQMRLALDGKTAQRMRTSRNTEETEVCSMCGEYCAIDLLNKHMKAEQIDLGKF